MVYTIYIPIIYKYTIYIYKLVVVCCHHRWLWKNIMHYYGRGGDDFSIIYIKATTILIYTDCNY